VGLDLNQTANGHLHALVVLSTSHRSPLDLATGGCRLYSLAKNIEYLNEVLGLDITVNKIEEYVGHTGWKSRGRTVVETRSSSSRTRWRGLTMQTWASF